MNNINYKIEELDKVISELIGLKTKLMLERAAEEKFLHRHRLERYRALECHFVNTDYPGSHFRWSTAKKDTVKLVLMPYQGSGRYEGGLYETGPSFKLIVGLLQALEDASHKRA